MNRQVPVVAVALLAVLAGCSGGVQPPASDSVYSQQEIVDLVTGMNASDAQQLSVTHWQALRNATSYRGRYVSERGGEVDYRRTVVVDRRADRYVEHWWDEGKAGDAFVNATAKYSRHRPNSSAPYRYEVRRSGDASFADDTYYAAAVALPDDSVLPRYDFEYVGREDGAYVFEADDLVAASEVEYGHFFWDVSEATNASARLVVDERGFVRSFSSTVTFEDGRTPASQTFRMEVWAVGSASADRPDWVSEAAASTTSD